MKKKNQAMAAKANKGAAAKKAPASTPGTLRVIQAKEKTTASAKKAVPNKAEESKALKGGTGKSPNDKATAPDTKAELRARLAEQKPVMNLEGTVTLIEGLRLNVTNRKLVAEAGKRLDSFEAGQKEKTAPNENLYFNCTLTINDSRSSSFKTSNPVVIEKAVKILHEELAVRQREIEAQIVLPAA